MQGSGEQRTPGLLVAFRGTRGPFPGTLSPAGQPPPCEPAPMAEPVLSVGGRASEDRIHQNNMADARIPLDRGRTCFYLPTNARSPLWGARPSPRCAYSSKCHKRPASASRAAAKSQTLSVSQVSWLRLWLLASDCLGSNSHSATNLPRDFGHVGSPLYA